MNYGPKSPLFYRLIHFVLPILVIVFGILGIIIVAIFAGLFLRVKIINNIWFWVAICVAGVYFYFVVLNSVNREKQITTSQKEVQQLQSTIEEDFFTKLVKINFHYIDRYYLQTQIQANKSFSISVFAALLSFAIIVAGVILMYQGKTDSSLVATGAGILSELVAAVFFYLYNKTIIKMGEYHHKLVLTQNISLALKITEQMEGEDKKKAQLQMIEQLTKDINLYIAAKPGE